MATFQTRIEDYVGTITDTTALSDALTTAARKIIDLLPEEKYRQFTTSVADSGSGVSITGYRFIRAHKSGIPAREIEAGRKSQAVDTGSTYYATALIPRHYIENGTLYVLPSSGTGIVIAYPTVAYTDSTIAGFPTELLGAVVLDAAVQMATQLMNSVINTATSEQDIELAESEIKQYQELIKILQIEYEKALKANL